MKKAMLILLPVLVVAFLTGFRLALPITGQATPSGDEKGYPVPAGLKEAVKKSCMPCHSDDGRKAAKMMINFSNWDRYGPVKQKRLVKAMCKYVGKSKMPPALFIESSPELAPTPAIRDQFCKWSKDIR
jgi:hypothetical protein